MLLYDLLYKVMQLVLWYWFDPIESWFSQHKLKSSIYQSVLCCRYVQQPRRVENTWIEHSSPGRATFNFNSPATYVNLMILMSLQFNWQRFSFPDTKQTTPGVELKKKTYQNSISVMKNLLIFTVTSEGVTCLFVSHWVETAIWIDPWWNSRLYKCLLSFYFNKTSWVPVRPSS